MTAGNFLEGPKGTEYIIGAPGAPAFFRHSTRMSLVVPLLKGEFSRRGQSSRDRIIIPEIVGEKVNSDEVHIYFEIKPIV